MPLKPRDDWNFSCRETGTGSQFHTESQSIADAIFFTGRCEFDRQHTADGYPLVARPHPADQLAQGSKMTRNTPQASTYDVRIGVDLGGTKTEIVALDRNDDEVHRRRVATPSDRYEDIIDLIEHLVRDAERDLQAHASVGIGAPGALSTTTGLMKNANTTCLIDKPLGRDLERRLGRPVRLANDANCFTLSEASDGAGKDHDVVFGVIIGTGVGGGVVVHRRLVEGINRIAGEWGHNPLPWPTDDERPGPSCYCGKAGCIETFVSGPGLARDYQRSGGGTRTALEVASAASGGNALASAALNRYYHRLARSLATVINLLDPNVVVLGGGLSHLDGLCEQVEKHLKSFVFSDNVQTLIRAAVHGDASGVRGAAWLWPRP